MDGCIDGVMALRGGIIHMAVGAQVHCGLLYCVIGWLAIAVRLVVWRWNKIAQLEECVRN